MRQPEDGRELKVLQLLARVQPRVGFEDRVMRRLQVAEPPPVRQVRGWWCVVGVAAVLLLCAPWVARRRPSPEVRLPMKASVAIPAAVSPTPKGAPRTSTAVQASLPLRRPARRSRVAERPTAKELLSRPAPAAPETAEEKLLVELAAQRSPAVLPAQKALMHTETVKPIGMTLAQVAESLHNGDQP